MPHFPSILTQSPERQCHRRFWPPGKVQRNRRIRTLPACIMLVVRPDYFWNQRVPVLQRASELIPSKFFSLHPPLKPFGWLFKVSIVSVGESPPGLLLPILNLWQFYRHWETWSVWKERNLSKFPHSNQEPSILRSCGRFCPREPRWPASNSRMLKSALASPSPKYFS